jgi:hypothetical membrane protein
MAIISAVRARSTSSPNASDFRQSGLSSPDVATNRPWVSESQRGLCGATLRCWRLEFRMSMRDSRPNTDSRILLLGGWILIVWSITRILVLGLFVALRPDWNPITQTASELGRVGASNAWLFNLLNFYLGGVLLAVSAVCLYRAAGRGWTSTLALLLFLLSAASIATVGFVSLPSRLHVPLALPFFLTAPLAALLVSFALRQQASVAFRAVSIVVAAAWLLVTIASVPLQSEGLPAGFTQRVLQLASTTWFLQISVWMLRSARQSRDQPRTYFSVP